MTAQNFEDAIKKMDTANAADPTVTTIDGKDQPFALVYSHRMSETLAVLYPDASEALRLAVHAQHIERWKIPRDTYPQGRAGYHNWRNDLKVRHGETAAAILTTSGYDDETIVTVRDLIAKKDLATNPDAQALEDVACIVFFKHYAVEFAQKHEPEKVLRIIVKTWRKMSPHARAAALNLDLPQALKTNLKAVAKEF